MGAKSEVMSMGPTSVHMRATPTRSTKKMAILCGGVFVSQRAGAAINVACNARPTGKSLHLTAVNNSPAKIIISNRNIYLWPG